MFPFAAAFLLFAASLLQSGAPVFTAPPDTDHDGLNDVLEQQLLDQFQPDVRIAVADCSAQPARFVPGSATPEVAAEDGSLYGQVFPAGVSASGAPRAEAHFYHLWKRDCGAHGHALDTEHVAVLLQASSADPAKATWKALYWYSAAHEDTVCDVSQIARASTLHATDHGATVWVSAGKHASYLDPRLCVRGCGSDRCDRMRAVEVPAVLNLGEPGHPMGGVRFLASPAWPLHAKMASSNFPADAVARLETLPDSEIAWFRPGRHPAQGIIGISSSTEGALAQSSQNTGNALSNSGDATVDAISVSGDRTGDALARSFRNTRHALGVSARHVKHALGGDRDTPPAPAAETPAPSVSPVPR